MTGLEGSALRTALLDGQREVALVLLEHGASPDDETLTPEMQKIESEKVGGGGTEEEQEGDGGEGEGQADEANGSGDHRMVRPCRLFCGCRGAE